jgi:phage FluMu protein Com
MSRENECFPEIVRCSHCNKLTTLENFETHTCDLPLKECKTIEVIYFQDGSYKNKKLMTGLGLDGVLYTFEVVPRKPIPVATPLNRRKVTNPSADDKEPDPENLLQDLKAT